MKHASLPPAYTEHNLKRNLDALAAVNPVLAYRLCLPIDGAHLSFDRGAAAIYHHHNLRIRLAHPGDAFPRPNEAPPEQTRLFFGSEPGDPFIEHLLEAAAGAAGAVVWDRDPMLLRLLLMRRDFSSLLAAGKLRLLLGCDILQLQPLAATCRLILHPFLRTVYAAEEKLLRCKPAQPLAVICADALFGDDLKAALEVRGYAQYTLDVLRLSLEEILYALRQLRPRFAIAINYANGMAEAFAQAGVKFICWEIDPSLDRTIRVTGGVSPATHIFTYRQANVRRFQNAGFQHTFYLPLATNPSKRSPATLSPECAEQTKYSALISFVGSSMLDQAQRLRETYRQRYDAFRRTARLDVPPADELLEQILAAQRRDFSVYLIPDLVTRLCPEFAAFFAGQEPDLDLAQIIGELAAAEKRITYILNLAAFEPKIWGDQGWQLAAEPGIQYMGSAGHHHELNKIYSNSRINLDISRIYQMDIVPMRCFDILSCGGFVLAEHSAALEALFEVGHEIESYTCLDELIDKIKFYAAHQNLARQIGARGRRRVLSSHTILHRVDEMLERAGIQPVTPRAGDTANSP